MLFGYSAMPDDCNRAKMAGYDYVELPGKVVAAMDDTEFAAFAKSLSIPALRMNAYCPPEVVIAGPGYDRAAVREYAQKLLPRIALLGTEMVGIGSPMSRKLPPGFDPALARAQIEGFLLETVHVFEGRGVKVCFEALASFYCNTVNYLAEAVDIVEGLNHPDIKIVLDFYNMEHMQEADISLEGVPFVHVHVSDDDGVYTLRSPLKAEKAAIHQQRLARLLDVGYDGGITLEVDIPFDSDRAEETLHIMRHAVLA